MKARLVMVSVPGHQVGGGAAVARDRGRTLRLSAGMKVQLATPADVPSWLEVVREAEPLFGPMPDFERVLLEKIEERIFAPGGGDSKANIEALYVLKHKGMAVRHAVEPLIEATHKLYGGRVPQVCTGTQEYFRDVYDHLLRVSQQLDGLRDMVITAMQVNLNMISLNETEVTKKLASWAAIIAIPTLIAGIYGMNFKNMPELDWVWGYPLSVVTMVVLDVGLYIKFKKIGWL